MMRDLASRDRTRTHLDGANPARFGKSNVGSWPPPHILMPSGHRPRRGFDDDVRQSQFFCSLPFVGVRPLARSRHVVGITKRCALNHPMDESAEPLQYGIVVLATLPAKEKRRISRYQGADDELVLGAGYSLLKPVRSFLTVKLPSVHAESLMKCAGWFVGVESRFAMN